MSPLHNHYHQAPPMAPRSAPSATPAIFGEPFVQNSRQVAPPSTSFPMHGDRRTFHSNNGSGRRFGSKYPRRQAHFNQDQSNRRFQHGQNGPSNRPSRSITPRAYIGKRDQYHRKRTNQARQGARGSFGNGMAAPLSTAARRANQQVFPEIQGWTPNPSYGVRPLIVPTADRVPYTVSAPSQRNAVVLGIDALKNLASILSSNNSSSSFRPPLKFADIRNTSHRMYVGARENDLPFVSKSDNMRFASQEELRAHLDWLFNHNRTKRDRKSMNRACVTRGWYMPMDLFTGDKSSFNEQPDADSMALGNLKNPNVSHTLGMQVKANRGEETCPYCREVFTPFWHDERQEWLIKDAVRNSKGALFHNSCAHSIEDIHRFEY